MKWKIPACSGPPAERRLGHTAVVIYGQVSMKGGRWGGNCTFLSLLLGQTYKFDFSIHFLEKSTSVFKPLNQSINRSVSDFIL